MKTGLLIFLLATATHGLSGDVDGLPLGKVVPKVTCLANPQQSYALYLPSNYDPNRKWPLIVCLEPMARGLIPTRGFAAGAEKWGYIVVSSNNSRNYDPALTTEAVKALYQDAQTRFSIDGQRIYHSGFSGGARTSCDFAIVFPQMAGVLAFGASFGPNHPANAYMDFDFIGVIGNQDMNYRELMDLDEGMDMLRLPHKVLVFEGGHRWPEPEVFTEALAWIELQAYRRGLKSDAGGVDALLTRAEEAATTLEKDGQWFAAYTAWGHIRNDFRGMKSTSHAKKRFKALGKHERVKQTLRDQKDIARRELREKPEYHRRLDRLRNFPLDTGKMEKERAWWRTRINEMEKTSQNEEEKRYYQRLWETVKNGTWEVSMMAFAEGRYPLALFTSEIAMIVAPEYAGPRITYVGALMKLGNKEKALNQLEELVNDGFKNKAILETDPHLIDLRQEPRFLELMERMD